VTEIISPATPAERAATDPAGWIPLTEAAELRAVLGEPAPAAARKARDRLHEHHRGWLAAAPFCLIATAGADGSCDVSPKGDPPGFTLVLSEETIAIPERPGNRRADGFGNILANPHIGLIYFIPGRGDTLRINGRARLLRDAPFFDQMLVKGHRPQLVIVVEIDEVFFHCAKAFLRSHLWQPDTWNPQAMPSRAQIAHDLERSDESLEDLEQYYGPAYAQRLYG
jgi:PPOX class probable FMN-dependent enzyme